MSQSKGQRKVTLGMILLCLGGLFLGAIIGFLGTNIYASNKVLSDLKKDGYVISDDAAAVTAVTADGPPVSAETAGFTAAVTADPGP